MDAERAPARSTTQLLTELHQWIKGHLRLQPAFEAELLIAIHSAFDKHEQLWQSSKQEAVEMVSATFAEKMAKIQGELTAREGKIHRISHYFENLVADLTDKSQRDPKTTLMNFGWFTKRLELFLAMEQRGSWCGVGLVDIAGFKWYNDTFGHVVGDLIIKRVAQLLRDQVRLDGLVAKKGPEGRSPNLHARLGGDEFCFLVPDLDSVRQAGTVAERFQRAIAQFDWATDAPELAGLTLHVDVGIACLRLGDIAARRAIATDLAAALIQRADKLMYAAKEQRTRHLCIGRLHIEHGQLIEDTHEQRIG
jgi:diguanylate cyclase